MTIGDNFEFNNTSYLLLGVVEYREIPYYLGVDNLNKEEYKVFKSNNNTLIEEENRHIIKRLLPEFSKELNRVITFVGDDLDE